MSLHTAVNSFNAGEWTPRLHARNDLDKFRSSCRKAPNTFADKYGPSCRRPGTIDLGATHSTDPSRLIPFNYSATTRFFIEISAGAAGGVFRFWKPDGTLVMNGAAIYTVAHSYVDDDLFKLQFKQLKDVVYIVNENYEVSKLTRVSDEPSPSWTFGTVAWDWPAFIDNPLTQSFTNQGSVFDGTVILKRNEAGDTWQDTVGGATGHFSVSAWIKIDDASAGENILSLGNSTDTNLALKLVTGGSNFDVIASTDGTAEDITVAGTSTLSDDTWYHVAITHSGAGAGSTAIYVNGTSEAVQAGVIHGAGVDRDWELGGENSTPEFEGAMQSVSAWSKALSAAQVSRLYMAGDGLDFANFNADDLTSLIGHWSLNEIPLATREDSHTGDFDFITTGTTTVPSVASGAPVTETVTNTTLSVNSTAGSGATMTASANTFVDTPTGAHVGSYWKLTHVRQGDSTKITFDTVDNSSTAIMVLGEYTVATFGTWSGTLSVQESKDKVSWKTIKEWDVTSGGQNINHTSSTSADVFLRLYFVRASTGGATDYGQIVTNRQEIDGLVKVTAYTSPTQVTVDILKNLESTDATEDWQEGAWSTHRGFPRGITFHEQRLVLGGTSFQPNTFWGSGTNDLETFLAGTLDTSPYVFTLASGEDNRIQWLASQGKLVIGTQAVEWSVSGAGEDDPVTPTNIKVRPETRRGSEYLQPEVIDEVVFFVERGARKVRELTSSFERDGYVAPDMALLSEHLTRGEIKQTAMQQHPDQRLWIVTEDGNCASMIYDREQNVVGWTPQTTTGTWKSVACIYGAAPDDDQVWFVVTRNGSERIERLDPSWSNKLNDNTASDRERLIYVDSAVHGTATANQSVITGLSHLDGLSVDALIDGSPQGPFVVTGGSITLPANYEADSYYVVGLPYVSTLQPSPIEIQVPEGTSKGRKFRPNRLAIDFYQTVNAEITWNPDDSNVLWDSVPFADPERDMDSPLPLFEGWIKQPLIGNNEDQLNFAIRQTQPLPLTVRQIVVRYGVFGN